MKAKLISILLVFASFIQIHAQDIMISEKKDPGFFPVISDSASTAILR